MEYIIKGFSNRGGVLGEPPRDLVVSDETTLKRNIIETFNNCDYIGTITLKGSYKLRMYQGDIRNQFIFFNQVKNIIQEYCQYYVINYEIHKCNEWVHSHFIFRPFKRSQVPKMRREIYHLIEGHSLKGKSYRHRILIEKPYQIPLYTEYIFKQYEDMKYYNLHSHYKLLLSNLV